MLATHRLDFLRIPKPAARWIPVAVFSAAAISAAAFRAVLPESMQANESSDYAAFYEPVARSILAGRGPYLPTGAPATAVTPGFPLLLAGVFKLSALFSIPDSIALAIFLCGSAGVAALLLFMLAQTIWGTGPALAVTALWMTYPFALWFVKQPNSEVPFIAILYGGISLWIRNLMRGTLAWQWYAIAGLLLGASALVRPIAGGLALVCAGVTWFALRKASRRARLVVIACLISGSIGAIMPWELWMFHASGRFIPPSTSGTSSVRDGLSFALDAKSYRREIAVPADVLPIMQDVLAQARAGELDSLAGVASAMVAELRKHPLATLELVLLKAARSWYGTDSGRYETLILFAQLFYLVLIAVGGWHTWRQGAPGRRLVAILLFITLYFWGMTVMALSILRYMVPAIGLLFLLAPGVFCRLSDCEGSV